MTATAIVEWDDSVCDLSQFYSDDLDDFDVRLFAEYADLCTKLYESSPMTLFEARVRAWAHLIGRELNSHQLR